MAISSNEVVSPLIGSTLRRLRLWIRVYIGLDGFSLAIIWLSCTFFVGFAVDYFPVIFGWSEMSRLTRFFFLLVVGLVLGYVVYRWLYRKLVVRLNDVSLALAIERKFPQFADSLLTTIEAKSGLPSGEIDTTLFRQTELQALNELGKIDLGSILDWPRLFRQLAMAGTLIAAVASLAIIAWPTFLTASQRIYFLDQVRWPRKHHLEVAGFQVKRNDTIDGIPDLQRLDLPINGTLWVAEGASAALLVDANTRTPDGREIQLPSFCHFEYWSGANRGHYRMRKVGAPQGGKQRFRLDSGPLDGIKKDIQFQVRLGDFRSPMMRIQVVTPPVVVETLMDCQYPQYMVDVDSGRFMPRVEKWNVGTKLPVGTRFLITGRCNKSISKVYVLDAENELVAELVGNQDRFSFPVDSIEEDVSLQFLICDTDGVFSQNLHRVSIVAVEDQAPRVNVSLKGIGSSITSDAVVPFHGNVVDDYDIQETWIEIDRVEHATSRLDFELGAKGDFETKVDFRQIRQNKLGFSLSREGDQPQVSMVIKSSDSCSLGGGPNVGVGDRFVLNIVSPAELLRILERQEVGQRKRLEQVHRELVDARDYLIRAKIRKQNEIEILAEPGDQPNNEAQEAVDSEETGALKRHEINLLFAQRAGLQVDKSQNEIRGITLAFDDIRMQLINNRVDSEDRKKRLRELVLTPLRAITDEQMQRLQAVVEELESNLRKLQVADPALSLFEEVDAQAAFAVQQMDKILSRIDGVLAVLVKYETQNELLELVRKMIKKQNEILKRTEQERERQAFDGLLD